MPSDKPITTDIGIYEVEYIYHLKERAVMKVYANDAMNAQDIAVKMLKVKLTDKCIIDSVKTLGRKG